MISLLVFLAVLALSVASQKVEKEESFTISRCCAVYAVGAAVAGGAAFSASIPYALGFPGFTAAGPAAGSAAAAWQTTMSGTVVGGGLFATLQSIAMAGVGGAATVSMGTATGLAMTNCEKLEENGLCDPVDFVKSRL